MTDILSKNGTWVTISYEWYNSAKSDYTNPFYKAMGEAQKAVDTVASAGDIGSLRIALSMNDMERFNEKRRRFVSFCNGIHYELSKLVDTPFSVKVSDFTQAAYDLDPSKIKVKTGRFPMADAIFFGTPLTKLVASTITDNQLREDFERKYRALDDDVPPATLKESMKEARFWEGEFQKSEKIRQVAEEVFTPAVRADWPNMSRAEREAVVNEYAGRIGEIYYEIEIPEWDMHFGVVRHVGYLSGNGYGLSHGNGTIEINEQFVTDGTGNFSVDKVIDTLTHEARHEYQAEVKRHPDEFGIPQDLLDEWNLPYQSAQNNYQRYYNQEVERDARGFAAVSRPRQ
jgi:hypothetical protein